jgi:tetratricopeptide (TPR) repeat protein
LIILKRFNDAIECHDQVIQLDPNDSEAFNFKGLALNELYKFKEALTCFNEAIRLDVNNSNAHYNKNII